MMATVSFHIQVFLESFQIINRKSLRSWGLVVRYPESERAEFLECVLRLAAVFRDREVRESLEVEHCGVSPPECVLRLTYELDVHLVPTLVVHEPAY